MAGPFGAASTTDDLLSRQIFPLTTKNRIPDPSEILALEFKGEFRRSAICSVSQMWPSRAGRDTAHHSRIERRRFKRSQLGFRPVYGKRRRRPAARQSRDMDSPARSGAYAASLRDTNSVKSPTRFVLRVSPC